MRPLLAKSSENKVLHPESAPGKPPSSMSQFAGECWFEDACILGMDHFVKSLSTIKAKGVRPDLIGSIIAHYASKWLPDLSPDQPTLKPHQIPQKSPTESATATWMKKRFFVETIVGILPPERDSVSCNFLLRLLRTANMVGADPSYREELERRIGWQLEQASLKEVMIPAFDHTCATLLDIGLVLRLVRTFVGLEEAARSGSAMVKVGKLVDMYLAEVALDANLEITDFAALGGALPSHARAVDDGLYRAVDTYLKAHPETPKKERKLLCGLIDSRKLSPEASLHAAQNERLPVRAVIQVLFSDQARINRQMEWSGSLSLPRSPTQVLHSSSRCPSKREVSAQHTETRRLREEVMRLNNAYNAIQAQMEKLMEKKKNKKRFFGWRKLRTPSPPCPSTSTIAVGKVEDVKGVSGANSGARTPIQMKQRLFQRTPSHSWRKSMP